MKILLGYRITVLMITKQLLITFLLSNIKTFFLLKYDTLKRVLLRLVVSTSRPIEIEIENVLRVETNF
jgi:hypothetical protein